MDQAVSATDVRLFLVAPVNPCSNEST